MNLNFLIVGVALVISVSVAQEAEPFHIMFSPDDAGKLCGVIQLASDFRAAGSGFVFGPEHDVVTCWHVKSEAEMIGQTNLLYLSGTNHFRLTLKYMLPKYDLAVFTACPSIPCPRTRVGDFKRIRPGDPIIYLGYDQRLSNEYAMTTGMQAARVSAIGSVLNDGVVVDFLEFQGNGIPGYSGGAVFNTSGELIAIMREAWSKKGIKGGQEVLINRAFSIEILSVLDGQILKEMPTGSSGTNSTHIGVLDLLDTLHR